MSTDEVRQKFRSNAARAVDEERIAALEEMVLQLETLPDISALVDLAVVKELSNV
jgi:hypothetical protein